MEYGDKGQGKTSNLESIEQGIEESLRTIIMNKIMTIFQGFSLRRYWVFFTIKEYWTGERISHQKYNRYEQEYDNI